MKAPGWSILLVLAAATVCLAQSAPREIAGLRLGTDIKAYSEKIDTKRTEVEMDQPYLTTVMLNPVPGFRSGYVTYGNCASPGRIARIKMNYDDDSEEFYKKLLAALTKSYGEPQQWRGNPFGSLRIWKWSLKDQNLGDISVILQYYSGDDDSFTKGNSIRIAATDILQQESICYREKHPESRLITPQAPVPQPGLEYFLPH